MTIQDAINGLEHSDKPVARSLHSGHHFRVLVMAFKKGMILEEHVAHHPAKLTVIYGSVVYQSEGKETVLQQYDEIEISVGVPHLVEATEDSLCLLTQGDNP